MPQKPAGLSILLAEVDTAAARLRRHLALPPHHEDDLRQELLADLIRRVPGFDRGTLGAFAGMVLRHRSSRIAARVYRERRAAGGPLLSLDTSWDDGQALGDRVTVDQGLGVVNEATVAERRLDLSAILRALDHRDRAFCIAVARWPVDALASRGFGSRASLYRRLRELRCRLTAFGFRAA